MYNFYCKQIAFSFKAINQNSSIYSVSFFLFLYLQISECILNTCIWNVIIYFFVLIIYINLQLLDRFFLSLYTMVYLTLISQVEHPGQPLVSSTPIPGATGSGPQGVPPGATASPTAPTSVAQVRPEGKHLHKCLTLNSIKTKIFSVFILRLRDFISIQKEREIRYHSN